MKAIVLTYDKQIPLAELVVKAYRALWKDCPLEFVIPRNNDNSSHFDFLSTQSNVTLMRSPSSIRGTVAALLDGVDDNEWVYWCIDDRYPVALDQPSMNRIFDFISSAEADKLNGIKLVHWREAADEHGREMLIGHRRFQFQKPCSLWGFWHHHFLRAKVLKEIFIASSSAFPGKVPDEYRQHFNFLPHLSFFEGVIYPLELPVVEFGETMIAGGLLANCCEDLARYGCPVPECKKDPRSIFFKGRNSWQTVEALKTGRQTAPDRVRKGVLQTVRSWVQRP